MNQEETELIHIHGLSIAFERGGDVVGAVKDFSASLKSGRTVAVVGESGSGKSVTSLSLMNLLPPSTTRFPSGTLHLSSRMSGSAMEVKPGDSIFREMRGHRIAMIFQEPMTALNPVMRCGLQVAEAIRAHRSVSRKEAREEVIRLFHEVSIPDPEKAFEKYPHEMSGGQRQRVMIAMAVSCRPSLLIADEPTTALDVSVQKSVIRLIRDLQMKYSMAVLFITHDLGLVAEVADDVIVMERGSVVETGPAERVLNEPGHPYTRKLLAARPSPEKKGRSLISGELYPQHDASAQSGRSVMEIRQLVKTYTGKRRGWLGSSSIHHAVDHLDFEIREGETLGLVGESGCGKTTLSRMLLGLVPATSGQIIFRGRNMMDEGKNAWKELKRDVQIVFQDPYSALNPSMTVGEMISEPIRYYGLRKNGQDIRQRVMELLHQVGLGAEHYSRYPHEFSGGQRQRIVIARALAVEPALLICDESVSALDVSVQAQVLDLLQTLKYQMGLTYLFISHDLHVVYYMSDRIMVMRSGQIEEMASAKEIFHSPQSEYTKQLLNCIPGGRRTVMP